MGELITDPTEFTALFSDFRYTAFRLEVRKGYGVPEEDLPYQAFLKGEDPGVEWLKPWLDLMRGQTSEGKLVQRVRVVDDPPSDYLRFEIDVTPHNLDAGEDIRYLARVEAGSRRLPEYDYWVFDSSTVVFLRFSPDDRFLGFESTENPIEVLRHVQWRDAAWHRALTLQEYLAGSHTN